MPQLFTWTVGWKSKKGTKGDNWKVAMWEWWIGEIETHDVDSLTLSFYWLLWHSTGELEIALSWIWLEFLKCWGQRYSNHCHGIRYISLEGRDFWIMQNTKLLPSHQIYPGCVRLPPPIAIASFCGSSESFELPSTDLKGILLRSCWSLIWWRVVIIHILSRESLFKNCLMGLSLLEIKCHLTSPTERNRWQSSEDDKSSCFFWHTLIG
jgi:hypothetical protein